MKHIRIANSDAGLYEQMFKVAPSVFISRPQFLTTMRKVFHFEIASIGECENLIKDVIEDVRWLNLIKYVITIMFYVDLLDSVNDVESLNSLNTLYSAFDQKNRDEMDWRSFLLLLNLLYEPEMGFIISNFDYIFILGVLLNRAYDQLKFGFCLYASSGEI